jgi:hypothetical protein
MVMGLAHFLHGFITGIIIPGVSLILIGIFTFFLSFIHEWGENLLQDIANIVTIIGILFIFISIQSAWPLLNPRIEIEYDIKSGVYDVASNKQYASQYAKVTVIPPLFSMVRNTTYVIAHDIKWIEEQESNPLIRIYKASEREIVIELNCNGWQWNKISEKIYLFSDRKLNEINK